MPAFDRFALAAARTVEAVFAEQVLWQPWRPSQYSVGAADPERPAMTLAGIFRQVSQSAQESGDRPGHQFGIQMAETQSSVSFSDGRLDIRKGDRLQLIERPGQPWLEVTNPNLDSSGLLKAYVSALPGVPA